MSANADSTPLASDPTWRLRTAMKFVLAIILIAIGTWLTLNSHRWSDFEDRTIRTWTAWLAETFHESIPEDRARSLARCPFKVFPYAIATIGAFIIFRQSFLAAKARFSWAMVAGLAALGVIAAAFAFLLIVASILRYDDPGIWRRVSGWIDLHWHLLHPAAIAAALLAIIAGTLLIMLAGRSRSAEPPAPTAP